MKIRTCLTIWLSVFTIGCGEQEPIATAQDADASVASESISSNLSATEAAGMGSEMFIRHMHNHATHLAGLNDALAAGDLEAAKTPAHWLLRHEEVTEFPDALQPHIDAMRDAARAVAEAADISAARSAAQRITESCSACHLTAGVDVDLSNLSFQ